MDSVFSSPDFDERLAAVTESIAEEIDDRFRQRLCALIRRKLNPAHRPKVSASDVAQQGIVDFFKYVEGKEDLQVSNWRDLWSLLRLITMRRMLKEIRKAGREAEWPEMLELPANVSKANAKWLGDLLEDVLAGMPSPGPEILRLRLLNDYRLDEVLDILLAELPASDLQILQLRLQGHSEREVGETVGLGREAARFRLGRIRDQLRKRLADDSRDPTQWVPVP